MHLLVDGLQVNRIIGADAGGRIVREQNELVGDEQRARIECDLHDGAQQELVALVIALRSAQRRVDAAAQPELAQTLAQASERADLAVSELRELAGGIHPAILVEAGLPAALASLAGCVGRIGSTVESKKGEQPWRCSYCGHLLRSNDDMSQKRCPRCYHKNLGKITEEELQQYLKDAAK